MPSDCPLAQHHLQMPVEKGAHYCFSQNQPKVTMDG
jgi:hypothetical protein